MLDGVCDVADRGCHRRNLECEASNGKVLGITRLANPAVLTRFVSSVVILFCH